MICPFYFRSFKKNTLTYSKWFTLSFFHGGFLQQPYSWFSQKHFSLRRNCWHAESGMTSSMERPSCWHCSSFNSSSSIPLWERWHLITDRLPNFSSMHFLHTLQKVTEYQNTLQLHTNGKLATFTSWCWTENFSFSFWQ